MAMAGKFPAVAFAVVDMVVTECVSLDPCRIHLGLFTYDDERLDKGKGKDKDKDKDVLQSDPGEL
ncbi:hypothetical protein EDD11_006217 [Mortierella claussenii]|nr:hypothetical protein EDD11_006217 [Mortierella claussenii]